MKNYTFQAWRRIPAILKKTLLVMKITVLLILMSLSQLSAAVYGQRMVFKASNISLAKLFKEVKKQSGYNLVWRSEELSDLPRVNVAINSSSITDIIESCIKDRPLEYQIINKTVVLKRRQPDSADNSAAAALFTGLVTDEQRRPLAGVSIRIKGTKLQSMTDEKGKFRLLLYQQRPVFQFSFVGYISQEIEFKDSNTLQHVVLKENRSELDQVQIIAYGTTSKRLNPGNVTTITAGDIAHSPVTNVFQAIQGRVPGLFIEQNTGQVGGSINVRIRNSGNLTSTSNTSANAPQPLIVVDGVTIPGGQTPQMTTDGRGRRLSFNGGNALNYLNPADIETIEVLKDADATAIYGSRGAYGVILISTKRSKPGPATLNLNVYSGISVNGAYPQLMDTRQYLMIRREGLKNDNKNAPAATDLDINGAWPEDRYSNWYEQVLGNYAANNNLSVNYGGGTAQTSYLISGTFRNQQNIVKGKGVNRDGGLRFSLSSKSLNNKFSLVLNGSYLASVNTMLSLNLTGDQLLRAPNAPPYHMPDGSLNYELPNPLLALNTIYKNAIGVFSSNLFLNYIVVKGLTLKTVLGYSETNSRELAAAPSTSFAPSLTSQMQSASKFNGYNRRSIVVNPFLEYSTDLMPKLNLNVKTGAELNDRSEQSNSITGSNFVSDALLYNPDAGTEVSSEYNVIPNRNLGFFGIIKLIWDKKYVLNVNGRRDGSTKFGSGNRFGNFGSIAAAWIFTEEKWFSDKMAFLSFGKLRASKGTVGGDAIGNFLYLNTYNPITGTYVNKAGLSVSSLANPNLQWEKNTRSEAGVEMGFLKDRIFVQASYYYNKAGNQLIRQPLASTTGFVGYPINSDAVIRTNGWEFVWSTKNLQGRDFSWSTSFNISFPKSKLLSLPNYPTGNLSNFVLNKPVTGILLFKSTGVNPQTGNYNFINALGQTVEAAGLNATRDKTELADLAPKYHGGLQNTFSYRRLSLDFLFIFTNRIGASYRSQLTYYPGVYNVNLPLSYLDRWQHPGDQTDYPRASSSIVALDAQNIFRQSTGAYENATYARLQNLSINYAFPADMADKIGVKSMSVFAQGQNLLTISRYGDLDPENLSNGALPTLRVFTAGLNVTF